MTYLTTHFPDGRRHTDLLDLELDPRPESHAWAVVIRGQKELGHIVGPAWKLHRYEPSAEFARDTAKLLERTCSVRDAVVLPVEISTAGPSWTAIGFWEHDELQLVGVVPGSVQVTGGEDISVGGPWTAEVLAGDAAEAVVETYRVMDETEAEVRLSTPEGTQTGV